MATSDTEICNQALAHCMLSTGITSLTENSTPARACLLFYAQARDELLEEFSWPFARKQAALALIASNPTNEWAYSYAMPTNALGIRRMQIGSTRVDTSTSRAPYARVGSLIYTDMPSAIIEYTERVTAVERFPPSFVAALAYKLASMIAAMVTGGDPQKLGIVAYEKYLRERNNAMLAAASEGAPDLVPDADVILARA